MTPAAVTCLEASGADNINQIFLDRSDFGQLYDQLLCQACPPSVVCSSTQQGLQGDQGNHTFTQLLQSDPETAKEFLTYVHAKLNQQEGLEGLAASSTLAGWRPQLLDALALSASVMLAQVAAGSSHQLNQEQLHPRDILPSQDCCSCTTGSPTCATTAKQANITNTSPYLPSWLHPLLHDLRPDHVVVLVSQLLLYLAGLLEPRYDG